MEAGELLNYELSVDLDSHPRSAAVLPVEEVHQLRGQPAQGRGTAHDELRGADPGAGCPLMGALQPAHGFQSLCLAPPEGSLSGALSGRSGPAKTAPFGPTGAGAGALFCGSRGVR